MCLEIRRYGQHKKILLTVDMSPPIGRVSTKCLTGEKVCHEHLREVLLIGHVRNHVSVVMRLLLATWRAEGRALAPRDTQSVH